MERGAKGERIYLFRHGATDLSLPPVRMVGRLDPPLNPLGLKQAEEMARRAEGFNARSLLSSPLRRSLMTAEVISRRIGLEVQVVPDLKEIDYGEWEGKPLKEIEKDPRFLAFRSDPERNPPPGGEGIREVAQRVLRSLLEMGKGLKGPAIVIGHRTTNRLLLCLALGAPLSKYRKIGQDLACLNVLEMGEGGIFALTINDTCHLEGVERKCPSTG